MSLTSEQERPGLRRCLGPLAVTAQAVGTVGLTLTAVINIPQVAAGAGLGTWTLLLGYGATLVACLAFLGFYLHHLLLHLGLVLARALCVLLGGCCAWSWRGVMCACPRARCWSPNRSRW